MCEQYQPKGESVVIFACGSLVLIVGDAAAAAVHILGIREELTDATGQNHSQVPTWLRQISLGCAGVSWTAPVVLGLVVIVPIVVIARQGRSRTGAVVNEVANLRVSTISHASVAEHSMPDSPTGRLEFVSTQVSTFNVRRVSVPRVSIVRRRGMPPKTAATVVAESPRALERLLGRQIPALIHIRGGVWSRAAGPMQPAELKSTTQRRARPLHPRPPCCQLAKRTDNSSQRPFVAGRSHDPSRPHVSAARSLHP